MTSFTWIGGGTGFWSTNTNWSPKDVPGASDNVTINGIPTVEVETVEAANAIFSSGIIDISGVLAAFTLSNVGSVPSSSSGLITVEDGASLQIDQGHFENSGKIEFSPNGMGATLFIENVVKFEGAGSILSLGNIPSATSFLGSTPQSEIDNVDNDIAGNLTIGDVIFDNEANGTLETTSNSVAGTLDLTGGLGFSNEGQITADNGGTLLFGEDGVSRTFKNTGNISVNGTTKTTALKIAGNVTFSGNGNIMLSGQNSVIESDGAGAAELTNDNDIKGSGKIADAKLTLNNNGEIDADTAGGELTINTGSNTFTNTLTQTSTTLGGFLVAENGGELTLLSPVDNAGIIAVEEDFGGSVVSKLLIDSTVIGTNSIVSNALDFTPGEIFIAGGLLEIGTGSVLGNVNFVRLAGDTGTLRLDQGSSQISGDIVGAVGGDAIDAAYLLIVSGDGVTWQQHGITGTLSVVSSSGVVLTNLTLAGEYTAADFSLADDGNGGTLINVLKFAPVPYDFDGDTISDMLWRNSDGTLAGWSMEGSQIASSQNLTSQGTAVTPDSTWSIAGIADFNDDDDADILWRQSTTGALIDWRMDGQTITTSNTITSQGSAVTPDSSWSVAGVGDFDGQGDAGILWRQSTTGTLVEWQMRGATVASSQSLTLQGNAVTPDSSWTIAGIGDFNGDGAADILWRQSSTGALAEWDMNGSTILSSATPNSAGNPVSPDSSWSVAGIGDFNSDGDADILWRQSTTGSLAMWLMNGSTITQSLTPTSGGVAVAPDSSWNIIEVGDFDGLGSSGIIWQQSTTGALVEWQMSGSMITSSDPITLESAGTPVAPGSTWSSQAKPTDVA